MISKALGWAAKGVAGLIAGLVVIGIVVALVTQSMSTGAKASLSLAHYGVVMGGAILSYADNIGPDLEEGKSIGDKALNEAPATTKKS